VAVNQTNLWMLIQALILGIALQKLPAQVVNIIQAGTTAQIVFQTVRPALMLLVSAPNATQLILEQEILVLVTQIRRYSS
jgi:hypothetical protein